MQPTLDPPRMSTPVGQTCTHCRQFDAVAGRQALLVQGRCFLHRCSRFAAVVTIGDVERVFVGERRLNAWPRAHVDADLLAHPSGEHVGREGQEPDEHIGDERGLEGREIFDQRRRVGEIQHPGAAGPPGDHQPEEMLGAGARDAVDGPGLAIALQMLAPVAFGPALDSLEQIGPNRLRAKITAPQPAGDGVHQEQRHRGEDQQAGQVVEFLRPDLDEEEIESPIGEIDQHGLAGCVRSAIPAHEGSK